MNDGHTEPWSKPVTPGTSISAIAAVVLIVLFFTPWFSACNVQVSGYHLAKGVDTESAWWLFGIPLVGLAVIAIGVSNLNRLLVNIARKVQYILLISCYPLLCMVLLFIQFRMTRSDAMIDVRPLIQFEVGFFGTILATLGMMAGAVLDWTTGKGFSLKTGTAASPPPAVWVESSGPPPKLELPRPRAWLQGQSGSFAHQALELSQDMILIGNNIECQVCLRDPEAADIHAAVRYANRQFYLQDRNSSTGTSLNGQRVGASALQDGDVITIGETKLRFRQIGNSVE